MEKQYNNNDITVVWKPDVCIHSALCWKGLVEVFNPRQRPWINMSGAETEAIISQVEKCPSGALSWFKNNESDDQPPSIEADTLVETVPNGPLLAYGNLRIKNADGSEIRKHKVTAFCRCGASANKPYCDGTHKKIGFEG